VAKIMTMRIKFSRSSNNDATRTPK